MAFQFKLVRRVEFSDTDLAGIMHYSNFFRYMETAEHAFYRSLGFSVVARDYQVGFPRVRAECDFKRPLRFEDQVEIELLVASRKRRSITYLFRFTNLSRNPPEHAASGSLTIVCVSHAPDGSMSATEIPPGIADKIEVAPAGWLNPEPPGSPRP
jgi:acyl-CoA thioester hydrolase